MDSCGEVIGRNVVESHPIELPIFLGEEDGAPIVDAGGNGISDRKTKKRRHRNEQQKLSNSLAQKRYRERKKQAFTQMEAIIESLTNEVESLKSVKKDNQRLLQTVTSMQRVVHEQQTQLADMQGGVGQLANLAFNDVRPHMKRLGPKQGLQLILDRTENITSKVGTSANTAIPLSSQRLEGIPVDSVLGKLVHGGDELKLEGSSVETVNPAIFKDAIPVFVSCNPTEGDASGLDTKSVLENEWVEHMAAMEQVLEAHRSRGPPTGPIAPDALELLGKMVSNLYILNSKLTSHKMQKAIEENRVNNRRISQVLEGLAGMRER